MYIRKKDLKIIVQKSFRLAKTTTVKLSVNIGLIIFLIQYIPQQEESLISSFIQ